MRMAKKSLFYLLFFTGLLIVVILLMQPFLVYHLRDYIAVLFPKGIIALEERNLLFIIQAIMLLVIVPVYVLTFLFSWKYSASNPKGKYDPDLVDSTLAEYIWWGVPLIMTLIVGVLTWVKTYELDPYKPIASPNKEMTIQVVALQWKWLFIYPEEKIAVVNFMQIPTDTPIHFDITADAPMNSFWIPHLGGQIYAMPSMKTQLNLIANDTGDFRGSSANISGKGFAGMHFITRASSRDDYDKWITTTKQSAKKLNRETYHQLAAPSEDNPVEIYLLEDETLFEHIIRQYLISKPAGMPLAKVARSSRPGYAIYAPTTGREVTCLVV